MKKWMKICLIVLCVLVALDLMAQLFCLRINPLLVDRMELYTYDSVGDTEDCLELSTEEIWKISMLYNLSVLVDSVMADPPPMHDRLEVYFKSGTKLILYNFKDEQFLLKPGYYVISGQWLHDYIQEVLEKHNLPRW